MAKTLASIEALAAVLRERPLGLLSDIDGTLSPIVARPEDATVPEGLRSRLRELLSKGVRVGLVTGRPLAVARRMVGVEGVAYAADHGMTLAIGDTVEAAPGLEEFARLARAAEAEVEPSLSAVEGVQVENKGAVLALHYRRASDTTAAREAILSALGESEAARRFQVHEGRMVVELRPGLGADKGTAAATLAERLALRGLLCLGDDVTDIDMFRAAARLREEGVAAVRIAVESEEAAPEVAATADYVLDGVEGVERLLGEIVRALP